MKCLAKPHPPDAITGILTLQQTFFNSMNSNLRVLRVQNIIYNDRQYKKDSRNLLHRLGIDKNHGHQTIDSLKMMPPKYDYNNIRSKKFCLRKHSPVAFL